MSFTFQGNDFSDFLASSGLPDGDVAQACTADSALTTLLTSKGQITYKEDQVKNSLTILEGNYHLNDDITIFGKGESHLLEMHFNLSKNDIYYRNNSVKREMAPGMSGNITFLSQEENHAQIAFNEDIQYHTFDVHLPFSMLSKYAGESKAMDDFLTSIENNTSATLSPKEIKINPQIYSTIQNIRNCPFEGLTKKIYLESKIYELIAYVYQSAVSGVVEYRLTNSDLERINNAASLIRENLDKPFTIVELARKVGVNQTKLKSGFKSIFGNTIFSYLQETRMIMARKLLLDTDLTIQQISSQSGYRSISNFSKAFKQIFGYPPTKLRQKL